MREAISFACGHYGWRTEARFQGERADKLREHRGMGTWPMDTHQNRQSIAHPSPPLTDSVHDPLEHGNNIAELSHYEVLTESVLPVLKVLVPRRT